MLALLKRKCYKGDMTLNEIREILRDLCKKEGGALPWAKKHGVSHSHVSAILRGDKRPADKILKAINSDANRDVTVIKTVRMKFEDYTN